MAEDCVWDSWEDFADCGEIDKHVEQGLSNRIRDKSNKPNQTLYEPNNGTTSQKARNDFPQTGIKILQRPIIVHEEDQNRTAYAPQVKILKRPEKSSEEQRNAEEQKKRLQAQQPVRTLAQREAAYAEARQRIMGLDTNGTSEVAAKQQNSALDSRPDSLKRYSKQGRTIQQNGSTDVKRQPKGPNNGKGFRNNR